jgi:hypothetical protein
VESELKTKVLLAPAKNPNTLLDSEVLKHLERKHGRENDANISDAAFQSFNIRSRDVTIPPLKTLPNLTISCYGR